MLSSRLIPLIIASALFMENMDSTVIATSLPAIAKSLGTDPIDGLPAMLGRIKRHVQ